MSRMNNVRTIAISAVMALAVAVPFAFAQSHSSTEGRKQERGWGGRDHGMQGGFFRELDLTDAQKAQMKQIRESHAQTTRPLMEQIQAKRREIHEANQAGAFNEALAAQKLTEIAPLEAKLMGEQFKVHQQMLTVLTPDQKTKLEQSREQFKTRRSERRNQKKESK
jgi:protein CpxP